MTGDDILKFGGMLLLGVVLVPWIFYACASAARRGYLTGERRFHETYHSNHQDEGNDHAQE